jgi:hypothetical protein
MSQASLVQPPRVATWLVDLFTPGEHAESIPGDLLEEFSDLASKSGVASACRWYWRQTAKTIALLIGTGFRVAPWSIVGSVLGGYLLLALGASLPEQVIVAVLHLRRHHVTPYYTWPQAQSYLFWLNSGIWIGRLLMPLFIGCIVAAAAKGREMVATMTLVLVWGAMTGAGILVSATRHWPEYAFQLPFWVAQFGSSSMIVMGGVIIRESRSARSHCSSGA